MFLLTLRRLVEEKVDINCSGKNGSTAIHKAAEHGRSSVIRFLARKNVNLNAKGGIFGGSPLHHAGKSNFDNIKILWHLKISYFPMYYFRVKRKMYKNKIIYSWKDSIDICNKQHFGQSDNIWKIFLSTAVSSHFMNI